MAIKKFIKIENVGRLVRCAQNGPELNRYNVFFAENGRGKTTLCAVLRSLRTGQHEYITERKTIGSRGGEPTVDVRVDGQNTRFEKKAWSATLPEIEIFDATFVAQNVHAGEYVGRDHRSNLLEVIIGDAGVTLAKKVSELDDAIRDKNGEINNARKLVQPHVPRGYTIDAFVALAEDPDIDAKITAKTDELPAAKRAGEIKTRVTPNEVTIPDLPASLLTTLAKTIEDVSADAEKRIKQQITKHQMYAHGEAWLSEGLGYLRDDTCPFCGQGIASLVLVEAYKKFFSESYAKLRKEIEQLQTNVESALGDTVLATLAGTVSANEAATEFWKQFVRIDMVSPDHESVVATPTRELRQAVLALVAQKLKTPLDAIQPDATFDAALKRYAAVREILTSYNASVKVASALIHARKQHAQAANVATIERELSALQLTKLRRDPKVNPLCTTYQTALDEKKKLDAKKDAAKADLDKHADKMIRDYEITINALLKGFGAGFSITNSKKTYVGGTPTSTYQILINDHAVDLGDDGTPIGQPCFRTTLSAGDKSTLALAFFLARLDHDPKKATKIVVFDDPFNSQDRSRRERTAELMRKYGQECQQLFLLSHDPFFLSLVFSKLPKAERHSGQLSRAASNTTTIEQWDVEKETQDGYFREHAALASYSLKGAAELVDIARKIRPVLEGYLRFRFPNEFPSEEWLGDMLGRIRSKGDRHPMFGALDELGAINDYSKKYHHDTNPGKADSEPLNDGELQAYVQRTLAIAGGY